jgi:hypothetical protein
MGHRIPPSCGAGSLSGVSVYEHVHDIPTEDELAQLVGAATPHFAFQIRDRVAQYAAALPPDHPRQPELKRHLDHLEHLGLDGETAGVTALDLPPRESVPGLSHPG